jgi:hypothetical protein
VLNHFVTLLANTDVNANLTGVPYDLPRSIGYKSVALTQPLVDAHRILFGSKPDETMIMYRIRQCVACVLSSPLASHIAYFDPRTVELFDIPSAFLAMTAEPRVSAASGTDATALTVIGERKSCDTFGQMSQSFNISIGAGMISVTGPNGYIYAGTAMGATPLADTGLSVVPQDPNSVQSFTVDFLLPSTRSLGSIVADVEANGDTLLFPLFGLSDVEPLASYRKAFTTGRTTGVKMAAFVLALVYRTEERRTNSAPVG